MKGINSLEIYISSIKKIYATEGCAGINKIYYRGQSNYKYKLIPSLSHKVTGCTEDNETYVPFEKDIIKRAKLEYPDIFRNNNSIDELALIQHYGMPTRLMDVTENPLVTLYFACIGNEKHDGEVYVFNSGINAKIYTSYDEKKIKKNNNIAFVKAKTFCDRQRAQQGLFMWFPDKSLKGIKKNNPVISKIITIPAENKGILLDELKMVGISSKTIFPDSIDTCCKELIKHITKDAYSI